LLRREFGATPTVEGSLLPPVGGNPLPAVYRAAPSQGRLWLGLCALVVVGLGVFGIWALAAGGLGGLAVPMGTMDLGISLIFICPFLWFPTMRYELDDRRLVMRCGPLSYVIHLEDIRRIAKRDLRFSVWSSMRLPGFALGDVFYGDVGSVTMCATRALKGILLIETARQKYGLTPADEQAFLEDLKSRLAPHQLERPLGTQP
jgi:hypothetical protein